jgi:Protein of unknown function (DUF4236)
MSTLLTTITRGSIYCQAKGMDRDHADYALGNQIDVATAHLDLKLQYRAHHRDRRQIVFALIARMVRATAFRRTVKMAFRFRRSIGFGFGRLFLSKSGLSVSLGAPGAAISLSRRGPRANIGIPGTGLSMSTKLFEGRRQPSSHSDDETSIEPAKSGNSIASLIVRCVMKR